ncbi:MAG: hypothetical protein PWQ12_825 [Clostridiales bacterium]|jgi:hypothetical protein|nr:hypothetical protein [Clostridiales bacterium]
MSDQERDLLKRKSVLGASATEAWADIDKVEEETGVTIPSEAAVADAKEWVEVNQK